MVLFWVLYVLDNSWLVNAPTLPLGVNIYMHLYAQVICDRQFSQDKLWIYSHFDHNNVITDK